MNENEIEDRLCKIGNLTSSDVSSLRFLIRRTDLMVSSIRDHEDGDTVVVDFEWPIAGQSYQWLVADGEVCPQTITYNKPVSLRGSPRE